ncbi:MAG TPA: nitroreductase family protein [Candidatus Binatia bacterium]|nr:nitroreductase family protein [Candidatus Binatia bacterium]
MEFTEVVRRRRIVRHFANEPVDREVLERIAAIAQRTPSAGFSQGQRLLVVTDPELRLKVAEILGEAELAEAGFDRWISECAALFIPCVSEAVYHRRYQEADKTDDEGREIDWPVPYWWMDIGCTVMLVLLAAVDEGLAAGFAGSDADGYVKLRELLGIPGEFSPVGVIPVGRPLPDKRSPSLKRGWVPNPEFARWEHW